MMPNDHYDRVIKIQQKRATIEALERRELPEIWRKATVCASKNWHSLADKYASLANWVEQDIERLQGEIDSEIEILAREE